MRGAHLYVIGESAGRTPVKVGHADNVARRLREIQTGHPRDLSVLHVEHGAGHMETQVHRMLQSAWLRGEWFDFGDADPVAEVLAAVGRVRGGEETPALARRGTQALSPEERDERMRLMVSGLAEGLGFPAALGIEVFAPHLAQRSAARP